jgi:hypothetical protein
VPSVSAKQKHLMDAAAHNPAFAKKVGIPTKVAKEFSKASKGQTFSKGGDIMATANKPKSGTGASKMGGVKTAAPSKDGVAVKGKTKGAMPKMAGGPGTNGKPTRMKRGGMC